MGAKIRIKDDASGVVHTLPAHVAERFLKKQGYTRVDAAPVKKEVAKKKTTNSKKKEDADSQPKADG